MAKDNKNFIKAGKKKLVLIDGNALIHRAYHALPPLMTKKGELVNAVYGFASVLFKVVNDLKPDYILATFDLKGPTFRHKEFKEYKATRIKAPDELYAQIDRVKEVARAMNIPIYEKAGFEADDVIGTLVKQAEENSEYKEVENVIVTGDLDTLQLVSPKTQVYALRKGMGDTVLYNQETIGKRYGLKAKQIVDYKGLCGDQSDNIPGVKGIGEKTAITLLQKYQTLENIYAHLSEIKGAVKDKLERDKMRAFMSKKLATIVKDVPLQLDFKQAITHEFDRQKLVALFQELSFFSLIKRIPDANLRMKCESANAKEKIVKFSEGEKDTREVKDFKLEKIGADKVSEYVKLLSRQKEVAIYLETVGSKYFDSVVQGFAFCFKTGRSGRVDYSPENLEKLKVILENENIKKIGYNLKRDWQIFQGLGVDYQGLDFDVMVAAYVLNPGGKTDLENLILEELGEEMEKDIQSGQLGLDIESDEKKGEKIARKADYLFKLKQIYAEKITQISLEQQSKNNSRQRRASSPVETSQSVAGIASADHFGTNISNLQNIFLNLEMPLVKVLARMEMHGILLNTLIFQGISEKITGRIKKLEEVIYRLAKTEFNINSPKQLAAVLFEKMQIPAENIKKNKTGYSTASGELLKIRKTSPIIEKIEEYREIFKLKTTYLDALPLLVDKNSRIHTDFNQAITATGRLSSSNPNLQNIPIKTDLGQILRTAFVAQDGYKLVSADYSQIDLRVVAHVSQDKKMREAFLRNEDVHRLTAAEINKVPFSGVTEKMRRSAKALNFGVIYGMSVYGFAESAGIEREDAKKFIDEYMAKFSGIAEYMRKTKEATKINLYVETEMGRRRYLPEINSSNFQVQNAAERMAINMPIQGLAADIMKLAMIKVAEFIEEYNRRGPTPIDQNSSKKSDLDKDVRMLLQVHDEIILEAREDLAEEVAKKVKENMENAYALSVPLVVDVKVGDSWGEI